MKAILPIAYTATQVDIDSGLANNLPKGTSVIIVDANQQPIDIRIAQGGGRTPIEGAGLKNQFAGVAPPASTDDSSKGYSVGSRWIDITNDESYICLDAAAGSAIWSKTTVSTIGEIANLQTALDGKEPANTNIQAHISSTHAPTSAEQNINPDWNAVSGDAQILNKPAIPIVNNTLTSTSITEALSAAQGKVLEDNKFTKIVVGTIDANSINLQDNTIYIGNDTGAVTNGAASDWAWTLYNFKMGSWRLQMFVPAGTGIQYIRSVNGTFTTNVWIRTADIIDWTSYTPIVTSESGAWSNYTATGRYRIVAKMLTVSFRIQFTGTPLAASSLYVSLPSGLTMNASVMTGGASWDTDLVGFGVLGDSGTISGVPAMITTRTNQTVLVKYYNAAAGSYLTALGMSNTIPWAWAVNDTIDGQFTVPII